MAPARMISFIEKHVASCDICQDDPDIQDEIAKISEIILPESKIPKAVRIQNDQDEEEEDIDEDETDSEDDEVSDKDNDDVEDDPDLLDPLE